MQKSRVTAMTPPRIAQANTSSLHFLVLQPKCPWEPHRTRPLLPAVDREATMGYDLIHSLTSDAGVDGPEATLLPLTIRNIPTGSTSGRLTLVVIRRLHSSKPASCPKRMIRG